MRLCSVTLLLIGALFSAPLLADDADPAPPEWEQQAKRLPRNAFVASINFEGNKVTKEHIMRQEMTLAEGDTLSLEQLKKSRQGILDLELFRSVDLSFAAAQKGQMPNAINLTITVVEKWYILPLPRLSANGDGDTSVGVRVRWNNIAGLNQRASFLIKRSNSAESNRGGSNGYGLDYYYPRAFGTRMGLGFDVRNDNSTRSIERLDGGKDEPAIERRTDLGFFLERNLQDSSKGWRVRGGVRYWRLEFDPDKGAVAEDDLVEGGGGAISFSTAVFYDQLHDLITRRDGLRASAKVEATAPVSANDFSFWQLDLEASRYISLQEGERAPSVVLVGRLGVLHGGPRGYDAYSTGGSRDNRGFDRGFQEGDVRYFAAAEYLHPVNWSKNVRSLVFVDFSRAFETYHDFTLDAPFVSLGAGFRWRLQWLVNAEIDLALAYGLKRNDGGLRFSARIGHSR